MNSARFGRLENGSLGALLLSIWLIATAVLLLAKQSFANEGVILAILALAAGVLLVLQESRVTTTNRVVRRAGHILRRGRGVAANLGILLLSLWLIVTAVLLLAKLSFANQEMILAGLAVAAGVLLLVREGGRSSNLGWLLLSVWLIVQGAMVLLSVSFNQSGTIMAVLALAAGVLILLRR